MESRWERAAFLAILMVVAGVGAAYLLTGSLFAGLVLLGMLGLAVLGALVVWGVEWRRRR